MIYKKYEMFLEAFKSSDKEKAIGKIIYYLERNIGVQFYPYHEIFEIKKYDVILNGQLFLSLFENTAIRLNWLENDLRSEIHSIDLWNEFTFESNPNYTLFLEENSVVKSLPQIVEFFKNPESFIELSKQEVLQENDSDERLKELELKLSRSRKPSSQEKIKTQIDRLRAAIASDESRKLESDDIKMKNLQLDIFKSIELYTKQVAYKRSNSLIISGQAGVGKTATVKETLTNIHFIENADYYTSTGTITTAGLYEILFKHRNKLIIFDDCDAVFSEINSVNILKGALDTYKVREIAKHTKGNTFDSFGMSDEEIQQKYEEDPSKLPNKFQFKGQIIFISNLPESKFDKAILSRSLHVDVNLSKSELYDRMRQIMKKISPELDDDIKNEALNYLIYVTETFPVKFDLNIRTLIHSINLRAGNDEIIEIGGEKEEAWKLLIKNYLIKRERK
jgi:hypothetical protein